VELARAEQSDVGNSDQIQWQRVGSRRIFPSGEDEIAVFDFTFIMKHAPHEELYWLLRHGTRAPFQMHARDLDEIVAVVTRAGAEVVGVRTRAYGAGKLWLDHRVVLRKPLSVIAE
jgi:hypothetical protein